MLESKYKVTYEVGLQEELTENFNQGLITTNDLIVLKEWKEQIENFGPSSLPENTRWNDFEEIKGKYMGYRSSSLGAPNKVDEEILGKRIIYEIKDKEVVVKVIKVDPQYGYDWKKIKNKSILFNT